MQADSPTQARSILRAKGLSKEFRGFMALSGVDLEVREGAIHALIGPNGAGKTTLFNLLTRFLPVTHGTIVFDDVDITHTPPAAVAKRGMVRSFQISAIFGDLTVHENVRVALQRRAGLATQFWRSDAQLRRLDQQADALLESVKLGPQRDALASGLSYGRKRVLELATTLALEPRMLLLDEPMAGLAHEDFPGVVDLIRQAARGRTVLMVEHNLSVVRDLCDVVTVLQRGEVIAQGSYAQVSADARVREAYMGNEDE